MVGIAGPGPGLDWLEPRLIFRSLFVIGSRVDGRDNVVQDIGMAVFFSSRSCMWFCVGS